MSDFCCRRKAGSFGLSADVDISAVAASGREVERVGVVRVVFEHAAPGSEVVLVRRRSEFELARRKAGRRRRDSVG